MHNINLKQIEAFVKAADQRSFRKAAELLNTTQPNISTRIAGLEERLGMRLLERDRSDVRLTAMGERLLPEARSILGAVDTFLDTAEQTHQFEGVLRIGVTEMIVHSWLSPYLAALKKRFPLIDVELTVDFSANLSRLLKNRALDLALQSGPFDHKMSGEVALGAFASIWVAAPHLGFGSAIQQLDDLVKYPVLTHAKGTLPYVDITDHLAQSEPSARIVSSTNLAACLQMTFDGLGVACLPEVMVRNAIISGRLSQINYHWAPRALDFMARYDHDIALQFVREAAMMAKEISDQT